MKRTRFFCENCGAEVRADARVCPKCGRFFQAVRCPNCGYTGEGREFLYGCPSCGYSGGDMRGGSRRRGGREEWYDAEALQRAMEEPAGRGFGRGNRRRAPPEWVYWLAFGLLAIAFV
ncbi:MAG: double zinc ribbon domain-containing protein, partial [Spirochaetaceae bacterium]